LPAQATNVRGTEDLGIKLSTSVPISDGVKSCLSSQASICINGNGVFS
jgi:hypothetical protein